MVGYRTLSLTLAGWGRDQFTFLMCELDRVFTVGDRWHRAFDAFGAVPLDEIAPNFRVLIFVIDQCPTLSRGDHDPDVVYLENQASGLYLERRDQAVWFNDVFIAKGAECAS